jgi:hypothetical protein
VWRIRDVYPGFQIPDPTFSIPDPNCLHPGSRILIKEFKYLTPQKAKKWFLSSKKYDPGCSSRIPDPDADFSHPGSRIQESKRHPIPDPGSGCPTLEKCTPMLVEKPYMPKMYGEF